MKIHWKKVEVDDYEAWESEDGEYRCIGNNLWTIGKRHSLPGGYCSLGFFEPHVFSSAQEAQEAIESGKFEEEMQLMVNDERGENIPEK